MSAASPKKAIRAQAKIEQGLRASAAGSSSVGVADVWSIRNRKGQHRRSAKIFVTRAKTDFYNPVSVLLDQIKEAVEVEAMTSEGREIDPQDVVATPPDVAGQAHSTGHGKLWPLALKRLRSIAGREKFVASWRASHTPAGYFFLFADRLLLVTHAHAVGWRHVVVPPEGIALGRSTCHT